MRADLCAGAFGDRARLAGQPVEGEVVEHHRVAVGVSWTSHSMGNPRATAASAAEMVFSMTPFVRS